jgi:predicted transglutaminase-like cysteine proteinase
VQHGAVGVWSSPLAIICSGKGDCKDYATSKFAALLLAGVQLKVSAS